MSRAIRICVWGIGAMGAGVIKALSSKKGIEITTVIARGDKVGRRVDQLVELLNPFGLIVQSEEEGLSQTNADVAILCTDSFVKTSKDKVLACIERKMNVISIAEEMSYPSAADKEIADLIHRKAKEYGVTVLGTGINPGFMMDALVIALTSVCTNVEKIEVSRVNSLSPFGKSVMHEQGVGISVAQFYQRQKEGTLAGHVGFDQSLAMMSEAFHTDFDKIEIKNRPIVSTINRVAPHATVDAGDVAGCDMVATAFVNDYPFITLKHPQQVEPQSEGISTGDYITIVGTPPVSMVITPEVDGGIGTIAMAINSIPAVINAKPGLKTMLDLPLPRAILGDMRLYLEEELC
jgi:2,4-diaminopentanoate dehydrogenase